MSRLKLAKGLFKKCGQVGRRSIIKSRKEDTPVTRHLSSLLQPRRKKSLFWAEAHKDWTEEDRISTLLISETYVMDGEHKRE